MNRVSMQNSDEAPGDWWPSTKVPLINQPNQLIGQPLVTFHKLDCQGCVFSGIIQDERMGATAGGQSHAGLTHKPHCQSVTATQPELPLY